MQRAMELCLVVGLKQTKLLAYCKPVCVESNPKRLGRHCKGQSNLIVCLCVRRAQQKSKQNEAQANESN